MMTPDTEDELAEAIRTSNAPLSIRGGGTRGLVGGGEALSTASLTGVTLHEPGALTLVVKAGTPVATVEEVLEAEGQRLAFEPMDHRALLGTQGTPTIGGVIAGNVSGPRRIQVGAARDFALGVRFVDGSGQIIKNGGRVMKNVTGYDLVKLLCGSWGTLGVLTEISLKVLPKPESEATLALPEPRAASAVARMSAALGSPFDVTGAAWTGDRTLLRLEGFGGSVKYRIGALTERLGTDAEVLEGSESTAAWQRIRDVSAFAEVPGDVWRVSVRPGDGPAVIERAEAEGVLLDWGGGLVWLRMPEGTDLRARLGGHAGHATLVRASAETRTRLGTFQPEAPAVAALSAGLRAKFDPRGILNPGLMGTRAPARAEAG